MICLDCGRNGGGDNEDWFNDKICFNDKRGNLCSYCRDKYREQYKDGDVTSFGGAPEGGRCERCTGLFEWGKGKWNENHGAITCY